MEDGIGTRNRRKFVRLHRSYPCRFRVIRSDGGPVSEETFAAETKDISLGGVGILAREFPDSGAASLMEGKRLLRVQLDFGPPHGRVEVDVRLRWIEKGALGEYAIGVEFVALPAEERGTLSRVLNDATEFRRQLGLWDTDSYRRANLRRRYVKVLGVLALLVVADLLLLSWGLALREAMVAQDGSRRFVKNAPASAAKQAASGDEGRVAPR